MLFYQELYFNFLLVLLNDNYENFMTFRNLKKTLNQFFNSIF